MAVDSLLQSPEELPFDYLSGICAFDLTIGLLFQLHRFGLVVGLESFDRNPQNSKSKWKSYSYRYSKNYYYNTIKDS